LNGATTATSLTLQPASAGTSGLAAAYAFDETSGSIATDSSDAAGTAQVNGATWTPGKYSNALSFNGSSNYVDLGTPASLQTGGSMSWSAWVYPTGVPADDGQIVARSDDGTGWQLKTTPDTGVRTFGIAVSGAAGSRTQRYGKTVLALNTWYHVAGVYNASAKTLDIYVNGVELSVAETGDYHLDIDLTDATAQELKDIVNGFDNGYVTYIISDTNLYIGMYTRWGRSCDLIYTPEEAAHFFVGTQLDDHWWIVWRN
jgi:hypothetical protein